LPLGSVRPFANSAGRTASDSGFRINYTQHLRHFAATRTKRRPDQTCSGSVASGSARINALLSQVIHRLTSHHRAFT
jgi:hypothetical protein